MYSGDGGISPDPSGIGTAASEPIIESGAGASIPSASISRSRAASASARLRFRISGQPPGSCRSIHARADGNVSIAVGSFVPTQSNSIRKRERRVVGADAPWLIATGRIDSRCRSSTYSKATPLGVQIHLWQLPV